MKIKLKRACLVAGEACAVGDVVECSDADAGFLLARDFAEACAAKVTQKKKSKV
ncbi:MAG: hypothetical protein R8M45_03000 [Ghiorsea sp.]